MKARARIKQIKPSMSVNKTVLELEIGIYADVAEELIDKELSVEIEPYSEQRSLSANAYYWQLLTKLARHKEINRSIPAMHNMMLQRYAAYPEMVDGQIIEVFYDADVDVSEFTNLHLMSVGGYAVDDQSNLKLKYHVLKGTHEFTKKQFSELLDGLVDECNHVGIPTATPEELELMKRKYKDGAYG